MKSTQLDKNFGKVFLISLLFLMAAAISISGLFYICYSLFYGISIKVLNTDVPGAILGLLTAYLGIRYFFMVRKLSSKVYQKDARFNWSNFYPRRFFSRFK